MTAFARKSDPDTSWEAALNLPEDEVRISKQAVLSMFRTQGPMTLDELETSIHDVYPGRWSGQRIRTAQAKLRTDGYLEVVDRVSVPEKRTRVMLIGAVKS